MFKELNKIPHTDRAGYDSRRQSAQARCLEHTRTEVLQEIRHWIAPSTQADPAVSDITIEPTTVIAVDSSSDTTVKPIYWVNGLAGIGKPTIARTVAKDAKNRNLLGASFFFSRQEKELSGANLFIPTISYQLAQSHPEVRPAVIKVLQRDPGIVEKSFTKQFKELIIEPLGQIKSKPIIIVVDALDECDDSKGAANELLQAVVEHCTTSPSLRLLITSRPERHIKRVLTNTIGIVLHDIDQSVVSDDIRRYLREEMSQIPERLDVTVSLPWPSDRELEQLVKNAGKLFIWAAMAVRFVGDCQGQGPIPGLKTLLSGPIGLNSDSPNPYMHLDSLYRSILSHAVENLKSVSIEDMKIVVGTVILLCSEMPLDTIVRFLGDEENKVEMALNRIQSIIPIPTSDRSRSIQIYHPSFPDFVTSRERCPDSRFYVDTSTHERRLALRCLDILNNQLSKDIETLLKPTEEASSLYRDALLRTIPLEVQYACRFWAVELLEGAILRY